MNLNRPRNGIGHIHEVLWIYVQPTCTNKQKGSFLANFAKRSYFSAIYSHFLEKTKAVGEFVSFFFT